MRVRRCIQIPADRGKNLVTFCSVVNEFIVLTHIRGRKEREHQRRWLISTAAIDAKSGAAPRVKEKVVTFRDSRHIECGTGAARVNKLDRTNTRPGSIRNPPHPSSPALSIGSHLRGRVTLRYRSEWSLLPLLLPWVFPVPLVPVPRAPMKSRRTHKRDDLNPERWRPHSFSDVCRHPTSRPWFDISRPGSTR